NLFKVPVAGGRSVRLTDAISGPPAISPDGTTIACTYRQRALDFIRLALVRFDDSIPMRLVELREGPVRGVYRWTQDGASVVYATGVGGTSAIRMMPIGGGEPTTIAE